MAENDLYQILEQAGGDVQQARRLMGLLKQLRMPEEARQKKLEQYAKELREDRKGQSKDYINKRWALFTQEVKDLLDQVDVKNYDDALAKLDKSRGRLAGELRDLVDPRNRSANLMKVRTALDASATKEGLLGEVIGGSVAEAQRFMSAVDMRSSMLPMVVAMGAGLTEEEIEDLSLFDLEEYDDMYSAFDDPDDFQAAVAAAVEDEMEATWPVISQRLSGLSEEQRGRAQAAYRAGLENLAYESAQAEALRDKLNEVNAGIADLNTAKEQGLTFDREAVYAEAWARSGLAIQPAVQAGFFPSEEEVSAERRRPFGETNPEAVAEARERFGDIPADTIARQDPETAMQMMSLLSGQQMNPIMRGMLDYRKRVASAHKDPAFAQWRMARGIPTVHPVSDAEYSRYMRQARRVGRPGYSAKRTGALREIEYADRSYGVDAGPAGMLFFSDESGQYLTPEEVEQRAHQDLQDSKVVEFNLAESDDVLIRVGNAIRGVGTDESEAAAEFLQKLEKLSPAQRARARVLFDKKTGDIVLLDKDRKVAFADKISGDTDDMEALRRFAADPDMAGVAASGREGSRGRGGNALTDISGAKEGDQLNVGFYVPKGLDLRTEPPKTTTIGEVVSIPGSDPRFANVMQEVNGEKRIVQVPLSDIVGQKGFDTEAQFAARLEELGGAPADPRAVSRAWNRAQRVSRRKERRHEWAARRSPLGAQSTAKATAYADVGEGQPHAPRADEQPEAGGEQPGSDGGAKKQRSPYVDPLSFPTSEQGEPASLGESEVAPEEKGAKVPTSDGFWLPGATRGALSLSQRLDGYVSDETGGLIPHAKNLRPTDKHDTHWRNAANAAISADQRGEKLYDPKSRYRPLTSLGPTPSTGYLRPPDKPEVAKQVAESSPLDQIVEANPLGQISQALRSLLPGEPEEDEDEKKKQAAAKE